MFVEVNVPVDGEETWWDAEVKQIKGDFTKVHFLGGGYPDDVVDAAVIRACTAPAAAATTNIYVKHVIPLPDNKVRRLFETDPRIFEDVRCKSGIIALNMESTAKSAQLKLIGVAKATTKAKMLLELHIRHQTDKLRIASERALLATKLEAEKEKVMTGARVEFPISRDVIGLVVGKGGKNIVDTQKATGVDRVEVDPQGPRVIIVGPTQDSVEAARELLEFVTERVDVKPEQIGWLIGRGGKHFKEMQEKTKVSRINLDKTLGQVVLVGTRTSVEAAMLYMETHLQYLPEFENETQESDKLRQELRNISIADSDLSHPRVIGAPNGRSHAPASREHHPYSNGRGSGEGRGRGAPAAARGRGRGRGAASNTAESNNISNSAAPDATSTPIPTPQPATAGPAPSGPLTATGTPVSASSDAPVDSAAPLPQRAKGRGAGRAPGRAPSGARAPGGRGREAISGGPK
ncbi:MAG: hypothetical protein SGPRY_011922 [Prymnesium sp.]